MRISSRGRISMASFLQHYNSTGPLVCNGVTVALLGVDFFTGSHKVVLWIQEQAIVIVVPRSNST